MKNKLNPTAAAAVAAQMHAQVARELPAPAAFRSASHRRNFQIAQDLLFANLQADFQELLSAAPDEEGRQLAIALFCDPAAVLDTASALHQARN